MNADASDLWQKVINTTQQALMSGALKPISTSQYTLQEPPLTCVVRVVDSLARKAAAQKSQPTSSGHREPYNPFLPYEEALFVADLSESHLCLLNKFNVVEHHLLLVTRHYESQDTWLTKADFAALGRCMREIDGLGFYNSGTDAGASQHHKHLQLIPFTPGQSRSDLPISNLIQAQATWLQGHPYLPMLPFWHSISRLAAPGSLESSDAIAHHLHQTYQQLMVNLGLPLDQPQPTAPYNLLVTREWMMAVRRSQGSYQGIGVNALGYGGWLLVKSLADLTRLKEIGPTNLLHIVGQPWPPHLQQGRQELGKG
jgi:ATP adenylyltransferase